MKLTKKLEAEILDVYEAFWGGLFNVDIEIYTQVLDDSYRLVGTTEKEIFFSKKEAIGFLKATGEQLAGNIERRKSKVKVELIESLILITDQFDVYVQIEDRWTYYGKTRVSTLMQEKPLGWKIAQQHFSLPDTKSEEGQTIGLEKIAKENLALREAIKRRTIELEHKNLELEIETALEKVRAVAMGMHQPADMLDVCKTLYNELQSLGFDELRNAMIHSFPDGKDYFINYDYSSTANGQVAKIPLKGSAVIEKFIKAIRKSANAFQHLAIKGKALQEWVAFRKKNKEAYDPRLTKIKSLHYYNYAVGNAGIGISTYSPITKDKQELLQRFRNVFQLAYQRYTDISLAEAQAKEAKIEAGLERVRSRSMAMHKTSELQAVIHTVHKELLHLNIAINGGSFIVINSDIKTTLCCWGSGGTADTTDEVHLPRYEKPFCTILINKIKKGPAFFTEEYTQKEKKEFFTFLFKHQPWSKLTTKQKKETLSSPGGYTRSCYVAEHTSIFIINHFGEKFSAADNDILQRFGKVFEQTYTRFLDLQKAEAQAREAQIEVSLERVRSRAMAMHKTDELLNAGELVYKELNMLGITSMNVSYAFINEEEKNALYYGINPVDGKIPPIPFVFPHTETAVMRSILSSWKKQETFNVIELDEEATLKHQTWVGEHIQTTFAKNKIPFSVEAFLEVSPKTAMLYTFNFAQGYLFVIGEERLSEMQEEMLLRFTKVFEMTYRRFLDLKQAEAQAREAEIELALERVRARTMAMQKSEELSETSFVLFEQFKALGETSDQISIGIFNEKQNVMELYSTLYGTQWKEAARVDLEEPVAIKKIYAAWKDQKKSLIIDINGADLRKYNEYRKKLSGLVYKEKRWVIHIAFFSKGMLSFSTTQPHETIQLLERFAAVFDGTYTRFLDLQKAEAQAREAEIELALERVRARTMAMQHSDELQDAAVILFQQLKNLGVETGSCGFNIWDKKEKSANVWMSSPEGGMQTPFILPHTESDIYKKAYDAMKNGKEFLVTEVVGVVLKKHFDYLLTLPGIGGVIQKLRDSNYVFPEKLIYHFAFFSNGYLSFHTHEPIPDAHEVFKRFSKVFEQTYTRFLDLQKAEAQAKEAQIELSLERVRARAMAMHSSEELREAAILLYHELQSLGIKKFINCGYVLIDEKNNTQHAWMTHRDGTIREAHQMPLTGDWVMNERYKSWKRKDPILVQIVGGNKLKNHLLFVSGKTYTEEGSNDIIPQLPDPTIFYCVHFSEGYLHILADKELSKEFTNILSRFTTVFEITFRRFLDLQKAEAQAREARIETALERVRSRTMAMQKSDELLDVASVLFQQVKALGVPQWNCGFNIWDIGDKEFTYYPGSPDGIISPSPCKISLTEHPVFMRFDASRKRGDELLIYEKQGAEQVDHYRYMLSLPGVGDLLQSMLDAGFELPTFQIDHLANFAYGNLIFITFEHFPQMHDVFKRFAKVFEQTYTRFLDLQKAEAQAREAKIEMALEKVRSSTMAMQRSEELADVSLVLFQQVEQLGIKTWATGFNIWLEGNNSYIDWVVNSATGRFMEPYTVDLTAHPLFFKVSEAKNRRDDFFVLELAGESLVESYRLLFKMAKLQFEQVLESGFQMPTRQINHYVFGSHVSLMFITFEPYPEAWDIFKRFGKVFEQTYTRFLDLQKAEAQAREAQIELGLERVRARAMAMQKSDELSELVDTVFKELTKLDFALSWCMINIVDEPSMSNTVWGANTEIGKAPESYHMLFEDYRFHHEMFKAWKEKQSKWTIVLEGKEKEIYDEYLFNQTEFRRVPEPVQQQMRATKKYEGSFTFSNFGGLQTIGEEPLSEANMDILARFGKVFDLTYTRFNDLKNAEAQAREAKIEAALETVRASSMAMHHSEELEKVVKTLSDKLIDLGLSLDGAFIFFFEKEKRNFHLWIATNHLPTPIKVEMPYNENIQNNPIIRDLWRAIETGDDFINESYSGKVKDDYFRFVAKYNESKIPEAIRRFQLEAECWTLSLAAGKNSLVGIDSWSGKLITQQDFQVLKRFAKVFEQAYTRFLDLQKAEAQAKEAKIEAALERVRSRTMAMHTSEEMQDLVSVVMKQLIVLGFKLDLANFNYLKSPKEWLLWMATPDFTYPELLRIPAIHHPLFDRPIEAYNQGQDFMSDILTAEEFKSAYAHFYESSKLNQWDDPQRKSYVANGIGMARSVVFMKSITLTISNFQAIPYSDEHNQILKRFANAFEQAYIRFLDLQKAEAQAREAKIEMALEKVRSRTMAMQKGEELQDVVVLLYKELIILGVTNFISCGYVEINEQTGRQLTWVTGPGGDSLGLFYLPLTGDATFDERYAAWKEQQVVFHQTVAGENRSKHLEYAITTFNSKEAEEMVLSQFPDPTVFYCFNFSHGYLHLVGGSLLNKEEEALLARFTRVFEQTYARFLDLKKAEAQAREAKIEAALEKVRSRTMAMQHSDELPAAANLLFLEVQALGIPSWSAGYNILAEDKKSATCCMSSEGILQKPFQLRLWGEKSFAEMGAFIHSDRTILVQELGDVALDEHYAHMRSFPDLKPTFDHIEEKGLSLPTYQINHLCKFTQGFVLFITYEKVPEAHDIFKRFTKVFDQTYTRFLDLQKAEAQAKEAQIETALESVRASSMAMHNSEDLEKVVKTLSDKLIHIGLSLDGTLIFFFEKEKRNFHYWIANNTLPAPLKIDMPYDEGIQNNPIISDYWMAIETGQDFINKSYSGKVKDDYFRFAASNNESKIPAAVRKFHQEVESLTISLAVEKNSIVGINSWSGKFITEQNFQVLKRFAKVFEQAYTRFLDLQKAEAQAREAQIEAALERVRSRTMAMQNSTELDGVIKTVYSELKKLDVSFERCFIMIFDEHKGATWWMGSPDDYLFHEGFYVQHHKQPPHLAYIKGWEERQQKWEYWLRGQIKKDWDEFIFNQTELSKLPPIVIQYMSSFEFTYLAASFENFGCITTGGIERVSEESYIILSRFAQVFDQTYTRFLDLQRAEAQAREAMIEAALERTRTQSMMMQHSKELDDTLRVFHQQVLLLGIHSEFSYLWLPDEDNDQHIFWASWSEQQNGSSIFKSKAINYPLDRNEPATAKCLADWKSDEPVHTYHLPPGEVDNYFTSWKELLEGVEKLKPEYFRGGLYYVEAYMKYGCFGVMVETGLTEDEKKILGRFAIEFERAYTRFLDLQKAEAQTRQAHIETALERVRARALAMQEPEELKAVAEVLRHEMGLLGVEELETCSIFINDEQAEKAECWYALKDTHSTEQKLVNDHFALNLNDTWVGREMLQFYHSSEKQSSIVMQGANRKEWINYCEEKSVPFRGYYGEVIPDRTYHLYKFSHGAIGAAAAGDISTESWGLLKRAAAVFSLAYSRFKDLTQARTDLIKLKEEKKRAEDALTNLQAAQKQLIQSEKMASLGELTAGIAHEIQNPLNFVNNFSEVSKELLDEIKVEMEKGNLEEAKEIMNDVILNLEKINHHGKRADGIVKGMLQHSRSSSSVKEPTDINALCDEYLRLSYHGLRAKDKSFNAIMKTEFDASLSTINVIPQDIGRVVMNLLTNAFYAVNEKQKQNIPGYEPTVTIKTTQNPPTGGGGGAEIRVIDNGNGIPQKVLDKIFQPFFTTKPTGQGTGLGLSLSYDIVTKGHGGELMVKTKEGEGSEFVVLLTL